MTLRALDVDCPRCGTRTGEPCWHLTHCGQSVKWPHVERVEAVERVSRYLRERGCEHPRPLDVMTAITALDALARE